jgi:hypothetical protein
MPRRNLIGRKLQRKTRILFAPQGGLEPAVLPISAASSSINYTLACDAGSYVYIGMDATLAVQRNYVLACDAGAYTYTGIGASLTVARSLTCDAGSYTYTGNDAILTYTPGVGTINYTLVCDAGAYSYTGNDATLTVTRHYQLACETGNYSYSGLDATLTRGYSLNCESGSYVYTGNDATLTHSTGAAVYYVLACETGSYNYDTVDYISDYIEDYYAESAKLAVVKAEEAPWPLGGVPYYYSKPKNWWDDLDFGEAPEEVIEAIEQVVQEKPKPKEKIKAPVKKLQTILAKNDIEWKAFYKTLLVEAIKANKEFAQKKRDEEDEEDLLLLM